MKFDMVVEAPSFVSLVSMSTIMAGQSYTNNIYSSKYIRAKFCVIALEEASNKINSYQITVIRKSTGLAITEMVCESEEHNLLTLESFSLQSQGDNVFLRSQTQGDGESIQFSIGCFSLQ